MKIELKEGKYWFEKLGVSEERMKVIVKANGTDAAKVMQVLEDQEEKVNDIEKIVEFVGERAENDAEFVVLLAHFIGAWHQAQSAMSGPLSMLGMLGGALRSMKQRRREERKLVFVVFNDTDGIYASEEPMSQWAAEQFVEEFPKRYEAQGYYKNNRGEQIDPKTVKLRLVPLGESPFKNAPKDSPWF